MITTYNTTYKPKHNSSRTCSDPDTAANIKYVQHVSNIEYVQHLVYPTPTLQHVCQTHRQGTPA